MLVLVEKDVDGADDVTTRGSRNTPMLRCSNVMIDLLLKVLMKDSQVVEEVLMALYTLYFVIWWDI